ncbi:MAG: biotin-dependent carboxyltransferase family protein [Verrucomicrobiota bacterium]|nr:biotin-dependent carboxyltransferase family protein [Verrucomicrobiota bacterium]
MGQIGVLRGGPLTTVQDQGRPGQRALGVPPGGALDLFAAQVANLLAANPAEAAVLEITHGGVILRFEDERQLAWSGGDCIMRVGGEVIPPGRRALVRPGEELEFDRFDRGCRAWLAIGGGIEVPMLLGSRATDLRAGFGGSAGRALRDGDRLSLGPANPLPPGAPRLANWRAPVEWTQTALRDPILRVVPGAEWKEFSREARSNFLQTAFTVSVQSDRMGARLVGAELQRRTRRELLSEAVAPGTVQVARDGQPILLLGDCQTIGGYPKIAHVITVDLGLAAQLRPNDTVRFQEITRAEATTLFATRAADLRLFQTGVQLQP